MCLVSIDNEIEIMTFLPELVECYKLIPIRDGKPGRFLYPVCRNPERLWHEAMNEWITAINTEHDEIRREFPSAGNEEVGICAFLEFGPTREYARNYNARYPFKGYGVFSMFVHKKDIKQVGKWDYMLALKAKRAIVRTTPLPSGIPKKEYEPICQELLK